MNPVFTSSIRDIQLAVASKHTIELQMSPDCPGDVLIKPRRVGRTHYDSSSPIGQIAPIHACPDQLRSGAGFEPHQRQRRAISGPSGLLLYQKGFILHFDDLENVRLRTKHEAY